MSEKICRVRRASDAVGTSIQADTRLQHEYRPPSRRSKVEIISLGRPEIRTLTKVPTEPPLWRVRFNGDERQVVLKTAEFLNIRAQERAAFNQHQFIFDAV